ncbi:hypothetical protein FCV25MIE_26760 [Fagus crenata]
MGDGMGAKVASSLCQAARLPTDMAEWKRSTNPKVIDNLRRGLMMGSLVIEDRYCSQVEELRKAIGLANRYFAAKKAAVEADKRARAELQKRTEVEESLKITLDSNSAAEEKLKAFEAWLAEAEESTFAWGRREAELDIARQLTGIYNESFQEGWKTLYTWSRSGEAPFRPLRDLPYSDAPIGVEEEEMGARLSNT